LGDRKLLALVVRYEVRFLEECSAESILNVVGGTLERKVSCRVLDERIRSRYVKAGVRECYLKRRSPGEFIPKCEFYLRVLRSQGVMQAVIDEVEVCGGVGV